MNIKTSKKNDNFLIFKHMALICSLTQIPAISYSDERQLASLDNLLKLSISDLLNISISSTSYFSETPLDVASSVTVIPSQDWEKRGAQRLNDAIIFAPSVMSIPNFLGQDSIRIRGYGLTDARGIAKFV